MPDPTSTEAEHAGKNLLPHLGVALLIALALAGAAYAFGYLPRAGNFLKSAAPGQGSHTSAFSPVIFGLLGLLAFLVLIGLFRAIEFLFHGSNRFSPLSGRAEKSLEQFVAEATSDPAAVLPESDGGAVRVSTRVAREGHNLLERFYPKPVCIELEDDLRQDLGLTEEQVLGLRAGLLSNTDRREDTQAPVGEIRTVQQLFINVEKVPLQHLNKSAVPGGEISDRSGARTRATDAERAAASLAASTATGANAIDGLTAPKGKDSGLRRRSNDYSGPRRRMTDKLPEPVYRGPYRRTNDPASGSRPRATTSGERRVEQTSAELSKLDPITVLRRNRPKSADKT
jgi:F0F1-type ATP synthase membrane subunit c/vacuolar-type H+-ATPase subunit K